MSVESRLTEATSELDAKLSRVAVPPMAEPPKSRSLVAAVVGPVAVILIAVSLLLWSDAPSRVATSRRTTTVTSEDVTTVSEPHAEGTTVGREMTGPIEVIDPSLVRPDSLAGLTFDPDSLGQEYRLDAVDDPDSVRSWFRPIVWSDQEEWEWTIVGQVAGFQMPVVVAKSDADTVVCAGREPEPLMSCAGEGFLALADGEYSPVVWFVPESTAVVGFAEHDNSAWQIPSGGAVAIPRFHLDSTATLTAYDLDGQVIAQVVFDRLVETNSNFDMLPQPPMVDLMRALLDRGVPAIAGTNIVDHNAPVQAMLGVADSLQVEFTHVDGSTSHAMIVGDEVRGVAIWSQNSAQLTLPLDRDLTSEDQGEYQIADLGDRLIVSRGVAIQNIVDLWNEIFGG